MALTRSERENVKALKDYLYGDKKEREERERKKKEEEARKNEIEWMRQEELRSLRRVLEEHEEERKQREEQIRSLQKALDEGEERLKRLEEILKDATSWHLRLKKRIRWPIQRLFAAARVRYGNQ